MNLTGRARGLTLAILLGGIVVAIVEALAWSRVATLWDEDLVCYLDNGDAFLDGNWKLFINPYWAPLYGVLTSAMLRLAAPPIAQHLLTVRLTNLVIYLGLTAVYCFLLKQALATMQRRFADTSGATTNGDDEQALFGLIVPFISLLFVYSALVLGQIMYGTPDLLSSLFAFAVAGLALMLAHKPSMPLAMSLGAVSALGYFSKTPILAFSIAVLLGLAPLAKKKGALKFKHLSVALVTLALIISPFVCAISAKAGHFTFSDIWRVGQSWSVFFCQPVRHGRGEGFVHPTRLIRAHPEIYEFGNQFPGVTYAAWYAPSYWYEGVPIKINWNEYWQRILGNALRYLWLFAGGFVILAAVAWRQRPWLFSRESLTGALPLLLPAALGLGFMLFGMDLSVNAERYYTPYIVPLYTGLFMALRKAPDRQQRRKFFIVILPLCLFMLFRLAVITANYSLLLLTPEKLGEGFSDIDRHIPITLARAGLKPGDKIAQLGTARFYFARLAKLEIIADIPVAREFWKLNEAEREEIYQQLRALGVKALVQEPYLKQLPYELKAQDLPDKARATGWLTNDGRDEPVPVPEEKERPSTFMFKLLQ